MDLEDRIYREVTDLSERGNVLMEEGESQAAVEVWRQALGLLPRPATQWEAATWLYASIGDAQFDLGNYEEVVTAMYDALNCPDAQTNPFVHLRLGQSLYRLGRHEDAVQHLLRAYMLDGPRVFSTEPPEYIAFLRSRVDLRTRRRR